MSDEILALARQRNVSRIIVGKPRRRLWKRILLGSIVDALVEGSGDIDVYVISGEKEPAAATAPRRIRAVAADWVGHARAVAAVLIATAVAWAMFRFFELSDLIMVYLLAIVAVAMRHGRGPSTLAAILSVAAFDFFFVPPYLTFAVSDTRVHHHVRGHAGGRPGHQRPDHPGPRPGGGGAASRAADGGPVRHEP